MRIGLMSAQPEENAFIAKEIMNAKEISSGHRIFTTGTLYDHEVVLTFSRWGKVAAAITTTHLITEFKVDMIIFTGVAGSCSPEVRLGDIVVGKNFIHHDVDARPFHDRYEIPIIGIKHVETPSDLRKKASFAAKEFLKTGFPLLDKEKLKHFGIGVPSVHEGMIASGDKFFASREEIDELKARLPEVLCVEMEGAAVAQVCYEYEVPCVIIRTISDDGSESSPQDFSQFVTSVASHYSLAIVENILRNLKP